MFPFSFISKNFFRELPILIWLNKENKEFFPTELGRQGLSVSLEAKCRGNLSLPPNGWYGNPRDCGHVQLWRLLLPACSRWRAGLHPGAVLEWGWVSTLPSRSHPGEQFPSQSDAEDRAHTLLILQASGVDEKELGLLKESDLE